MTPAEPLIVATEADGSGMGRFTAELANALQASGHAVTLVARAQPFALRTAHRVTIAPLAAPPGWRRTLELAHRSLAIAAAVWREAGPGRPLLMIHLAQTLPFSAAPILAARLRRARVALSLHDFYPHGWRFPPGLRGVERWLYRAAYRRCDLILTNNAGQSRRLTGEAGVPARRVRTLFHGPFVLAGPAAADRSGMLRLLVFGALRPNKRVLESIHAVIRLRAQGVPVCLRIAGAPRREDAGYWTECRAAIPPGDPGFEVAARFIGEDELAAVLSGVDAVLCPYAGFDSQSGVAVMAVSNALPVIASPAAGVAHVDPGAAPWGAVAAAADAEAIAAAVRRFMAIPAPARAGFAAEQQRRFLAAAGWDILAARYGEAMRDRGFWR